MLFGLVFALIAIKEGLASSSLLDGCKLDKIGRHYFGGKATTIEGNHCREGFCRYNSRENPAGISCKTVSGKNELCSVPTCPKKPLQFQYFTGHVPSVKKSIRVKFLSIQNMNVNFAVKIRLATRKSYLRVYFGNVHAACEGKNRPEKGTYRACTQIRKVKRHTVLNFFCTGPGKFIKIISTSKLISASIRRGTSYIFKNNTKFDKEFNQMRKQINKNARILSKVFGFIGKINIPGNSGSFGLLRSDANPLFNARLSKPRGGYSQRPIVVHTKIDKGHIIWVGNDKFVQSDGGYLHSFVAKLLKYIVILEKSKKNTKSSPKRNTLRRQKRNLWRNSWPNYGRNFGNFPRYSNWNNYNRQSPWLSNGWNDNSNYNDNSNNWYSPYRNTRRRQQWRRRQKPRQQYKPKKIDRNQIIDQIHYKGNDHQLTEWSFWSVLSNKKNGGILLWDAHNELGQRRVKTLLEKIKSEGKIVVIGLKPWAYDKYKKKRSESELAILFEHSGIWPEKLFMNEAKSAHLINRFTESNLAFEGLLLALSSQRCRTNFLFASVRRHKYILESTIKFLTAGNKDDSLRMNPEKMFKKSSERMRKLLIQAEKSWRPIIETGITCFKNSKKSSIMYTDTNRQLILLANVLYNNGFLNEPPAHHKSVKIIQPALEIYPGKPGDVLSTKLHVNNFKVTCESPKQDNVPLGIYMPPGTAFKLELHKKHEYNSDLENWKLSINWNLIDLKLFEKRQPIRMPRISWSWGWGLHEKKYFSAVGGLLWMSCKRRATAHFKVVLSNQNDGKQKLIRVPMFDSTQTNNSLAKQSQLNAWNTLRVSPVPWAIMKTRSLIFVLPIYSVLNLPDPLEHLERLENAFRVQLDLLGDNFSPAHRLQVVSFDIQILFGYMHSGYPIGVQIRYNANPRLSDGVFAFPVLERPLPTRELFYGWNWGIMHELAHNLQQLGAYTFQGTSEITNNIFTLRSFEQLTNISQWTDSKTNWLTWRKKRNLKKIHTFFSVRSYPSRTFNDWKRDNFLALGIFAQLKGTFGWRFYKRLFEMLEENRVNKVESSAEAQYSENANGIIDPFNDREKIENWIWFSSKAAGFDLSGIFRLWKWPVSRKLQKNLRRHFNKAFIPNDFLTRSISSKITNYLKQSFTRKNQKIVMRY